MPEPRDLSSLKEAQIVIESWLFEYNTPRPHRARLSVAGAARNSTRRKLDVC